MEDLKMQCDCCKINDLNEVIILRKKRFTYKGKEYNKYHRVCLSCAYRLARTQIYRLGAFWLGILNDMRRRQ